MIFPRINLLALAIHIAISDMRTRAEAQESAAMPVQTSDGA